jgi:hypothetical protein
MIERTRDGFQVSCDSCSDYLEVDSPGKVWSDATEAIRSEDWKTRKAEGEWTHTCPSCLAREQPDT